MSLLPPNATPLEKALEAAIAVPALPVPIRSQKLASVCPEALLPWLAWEWSVDDWDGNWPLAVRRQVVANSLDVHWHKGTRASVEKQVAAFGGAISIREWWETDPMGEPGTFTLLLALADLNGAPPSAEYIDSVIGQVTRTKPLSKHFTFTLALDAKGSVGTASAIRPVAYARLDFAA